MHKLAFTFLFVASLTLADGRPGDCATCPQAYLCEQYGFDHPDCRSEPGYLPYKIVEATYPEEAIKKNISGYVVIEMLVNAQGVPEELKVIEAEPSYIFNQSAINAVSQFRYKAPIVNGNPVAVPDVLYKVEFNH
jgi:TonB family protein